MSNRTTYTFVNKDRIEDVNPSISVYYKNDIPANSYVTIDDIDGFSESWEFEQYLFRRFKYYTKYFSWYQKLKRWFLNSKLYKFYEAYKDEQSDKRIKKQYKNNKLINLGSELNKRLL